MKKLLLFALVFLLAVAGPVAAQTQTQQAPTLLNACTSASNSNPAVGSQATISVTPSASNFVYVCGLDYQYCQNGTGTAVTNSTTTSTGLPGNPKWQSSLAAASINTCITGNVYFYYPLKSSSPGTAVTITGITAAANVGQNVNLYYYVAP